MNLAADFLDLLVCLNEADADYLLIGGYAVNAYGHVRATEDLDVWIRASDDNAQRVLLALHAFGMPPKLDTAVFRSPQGPPPTGFRFGRRPVSVDLLTSIQGVSFDDAWPARETLNLGDLHVALISKHHLLMAKRASGRPKDLADIAALQTG